MYSRLEQPFFLGDVLDIAPSLLGKKIVRNIENTRKEYLITEVEAYRGTEDLACHASKGRTNRTEIMFSEGGHIYMYLVYGMHWMFNIVTGPLNNPQAILIRSVKSAKGPGRVTRELCMDKSFYGERIFDSGRIWIEDGITPAIIHSSQRIGVDYAGDYWGKLPWRYYILID